MLDIMKLRPFLKPSTGIGRGHGKRKKSGAGNVKAKAAPREMTPEERLQSNIKVTKRIAQRGLMPEGAIYYGGTPEQRTKYYEAVDRIYKRLPEGYGYSFQTRSEAYGRKKDIIQIELTSKGQKRDYSTGAIKTVTYRSGMMGANGQIRYSEGEFLSRSALRGYAKAQVYKAAGKIYDPSTKGASEKYPALGSYGEPKK